MSFHESLYISEKSDVVTLMCKSHVFIKILMCFDNHNHLRCHVF